MRGDMWAMRRENMMEIHAHVSYNHGYMRKFGKFKQNILGALLKHATDFELK